MDKDPKGGGTNKNAGKSTTYCSYCYQSGEFTQPDITAKEMQKFCIGKMKEMGMLGVIAWFFTRSIPRLERWRIT